MGLRAAAIGRLVLDDVAAARRRALLGDGRTDAYAECVRLSRLGWCALAVGTAQAVLDYVIPYVNERVGVRRADQPPPGGRVHGRRHRASSWRACGWSPTAPPRRAEQGLPFAREAALARRLCADKGMQIGSDGVQLLGGHGFVKEHPVERWYRDLRADRPHGRRGRWSDDQPRGPARSSSSSIDQAHQVAARGLPADLAQVRPRRAQLPEGARHARRAASTAWTPRATSGAGAAGVRRVEPARTASGVRNGTNMSTVLSIMEMCWGDVGLLLSMPRQGLGNAAIASVANEEQLARFDGLWAAMAITEPECGSDSAAIRTTAGSTATTTCSTARRSSSPRASGADAVVVWATLDRALGRAAIKSFVVEKGTPGLRPSSGSSTSSASAPRTPRRSGSTTCRVPQGEPARLRRRSTRSRASPASCRPSTTPARWWPAMAVGVARAALERTRELLAEAGHRGRLRPAGRSAQHAAAAAFLRLEADYEAAYLLTLQAAWMADNGKPNSLQASMAKAKAGRAATDITLRCVELAGSVGYGEDELLEKWARDAKILDIFEGTQQIQQLIVARRLLGKTSQELR